MQSYDYDNYSEQEDVKIKHLLVSAENIASEYFICHIIQTSIVTISNNGIAHLFELG